MTSAQPHPGARQPLRLLLVEDDENDAELIKRAIGSAGYLVECRRVQTEADYRAVLASESWDVVVSDYSLPQFGAVAALRCLRECDVDLPFIVISGAVNEEAAVAILRGGAHDFITKQNLARLGPAIQRERQDARDRAARRTAQRDLQAQRDMLRLVIDTNPNLIALKDSRGRFMLVNSAVAELYGTTAGALLGQTESGFSSVPEEAARSQSARDEALRTGVTQVEENDSITDLRSGAVRWFETRRVPLLLPDGVAQVLEISTEITDRRAAQKALGAAEEQFRQAQKMEAVGQLAGGIAHDFNNLLTVILGYSDLVLDEVGPDSGLVPDLQEIRQAGTRAQGLTSQLLAVSRKQVLQPQILDLNVIVSEVEQMLRRVIAEDIRFEIVADPALTRVHADPGQLHQVLMNLAINARDAMPRGGMLKISTANTMAFLGEHAGAAEQLQPCVAISVSDSGCGMAPDVMARVFEPFFSTKAPGKGTGLGLAMVYGVVTGSGGRISVESEPGRGATFTIHLPVAAGDAPGPTAPPMAPGPLQGRETILLVEDEQTVRELVRKVLTQYGYDVLEAVDSDHAVEIAERHPTPIHLLLSDIVMPHLGGAELAQRIVRHRRDVRVLYMSGFGNRLGAGIGALSAGVTMLEKPFTPERLASTVREALSR